MEIPKRSSSKLQLSRPCIENVQKHLPFTDQPLRRSMQWKDKQQSAASGNLTRAADVNNMASKPKHLKRYGSLGAHCVVDLGSKANVR